MREDVLRLKHGLDFSIPGARLSLKNTLGFLVSQISLRKVLYGLCDKYASRTLLIEVRNWLGRYPVAVFDTARNYSLTTRELGVLHAAA
jgi:hypothetical protein